MYIIVINCNTQLSMADIKILLSVPVVLQYIWLCYCSDLLHKNKNTVKLKHFVAISSSYHIHLRFFVGFFFQ